MDMVQELMWALAKMTREGDRKVEVEATVMNDMSEDYGAVYHCKIKGVRLVNDKLYIVTTI